MEEPTIELYQSDYENDFDEANPQEEEIIETETDIQFE